MIFFVSILILWLISLCLHEYSHARVAFAGGDHTVVAKGYLTLNPLRYIHPVVSIVIPLIILAIGGVPLPGGAVYINHALLRSRRWKSAVSAAGPLANLAILIVCALPFLFGLHQAADARSDKLVAIEQVEDQDAGSDMGRDIGRKPIYGKLWLILAFFAFLQAFALVINLLPVPGLDGFGIIEPYLPPDIQRATRQMGSIGIFLLLALLLTDNPVKSLILGIIVRLPIILGIPTDVLIAGHDEFFDSRPF